MTINDVEMWLPGLLSDQSQERMIVNSVGICEQPTKAYQYPSGPLQETPGMHQYLAEQLFGARTQAGMCTPQTTNSSPKPQRQEHAHRNPIN